MRPQIGGGLRMRSRRDPARYLDAADAHGLCRLAAAARGRGEEVFATPLPRERPEPGKRAVLPGSVVWVDLDEASADGLREIERLRPHLWVASGVGRHLYWRLRDELEPAELEELNRRLCHRLGGDPACCEYGRIMRLPGTFNQKRGQWCRILRADRSRLPVDPEGSGRPCPTRAAAAGQRLRQTGTAAGATGRRARPGAAARVLPGALRCAGAGRRRGGEMPVAGPRRPVPVLPGVRGR